MPHSQEHDEVRGIGMLILGSIARTGLSEMVIFQVKKWQSFSAFAKMST